MRKRFDRANNKIPHGGDITTVKEHQDGRIELEADEELAASVLYNTDLAPVPVKLRTWNTYNYAALWMSMSAQIPTYMLAAGLIAEGMNWWQALMTVTLGNLLVLIPILLNSHPGTKYGIPFPVFARSAYGTFGSNVPALMRALVACGWFGIQAWIGGQAVNLLFASLIPGWKTLLGGPVAGIPPTEWFSFLLFWLINVLVVYRGMNVVKRLAGLAAPFVFIMTAGMLFWAVSSAQGLGHLLMQPGKYSTLAEFLPVFIPSLSAMIGFWATLSLNMPDFTRFGQSQRDQMLGQVVALPLAMVVYAAMGILITSAAVIIYPGVPMDDLWDPIKLVGRFEQPAVIAIAMFTIAVGTLCVNVAANVVSSANDLANAFPRWIKFSTGGLITGIIGLVIQPWRLLADAQAYIFTWLQGYSGGLGSIAGVLIVDYWLLRKGKLKIDDLYREHGQYTYRAGVNWRAITATLIGCSLAWIGAFVPALKNIYDYAWFVGFGAAALSHYLLSIGRVDQKQPGESTAHEEEI